MVHLLRGRDGLTLIEIVVSLVLLSVGILAIAQLQLFATISGQDSLGRTFAEVQAVDAGERMWLNLDDPTSIVDDWREEHAGSLADWTGTVESEPGDEQLFRIRITWREQRATPDSVSVFEHFVRLPEVE